MESVNWRRLLYPLSPTAWVAFIVGISTIALAFIQENQLNLPGALVGGVLTSLVAIYHQIKASQAATASQVLATQAQELELSAQRVQGDIAEKEFSRHALLLRDRAIELSAVAISTYEATAPDFPLIHVNPAFEQLTGYQLSEVLGMPCCRVHEDGDHTGMPPLKTLLESGRSGDFVLRNKKKDGSIYWTELHIAPVENATGAISHFVVAQTDITALKSYEAQLEHQMHYDSLTGLANRVLLKDRLNRALQAAACAQQQVWVLFLGLDRFQAVNETCGHEAGDAVLKILAARLIACAGPLHTVSRFGGDEFVIVLQEASHAQAAMSVVERVMTSMANPIALNRKIFFVGCSMGIAVSPDDGIDADLLVMHADTAMHSAKSREPNSIHFYTPHLNQRAIERVEMEADLRQAILCNQFILEYQPKIELSNGSLVGMEALIRWHHPVHGLVGPIEFIPLAEETGLIVDIGAWVIRTACEQMRCWQNMGFDQLQISVNLSARQFADGRLVEGIRNALAITKLNPACFQLELTESLVMTDVEHGIGVMQDLKALGIGLAVDDFGTGYSSLAYLKRLPIDTLKIDRSFVSDIALHADDAAIVTSIISLAHSLRLRVVAEGVESDEQLRFLKLHGCDEIQGFYFSRAIAADQFTVLLQEGKPLHFPYPGRLTQSHTTPALNSQIVGHPLQKSTPHLAEVR